MVDTKKVKLVRLLTGEELLAEVISEAGLKIEIKNPIRVVVMPSRDPNSDRPTVAFAPWMEFADEQNFTLDKSHVLAIMIPIKEFIAQYQKAFSEIVTPVDSGKLILPK